MSDPWQVPVGARLRAVAGLAAVAVVVGVAATVAALTVGPVGAAEEPAGAAGARFRAPAVRPIDPLPGPGPVIDGSSGLVAELVPGPGPVIDGSSGLVAELVPGPVIVPPGAAAVAGSAKYSAKAGAAVAGSAKYSAKAGAAVAGSAKYSAKAGAAVAVFQSGVSDCVQSDAQISRRGIRQASDGLPPSGHQMRKVRVKGTDFDGETFDFADFSTTFDTSLPVLFWFWTPH